MGQSKEADDNSADTLHNNTPETIQARIDALLISWQYATDTEKQNIQARIDALQIAITYAK